jgi:hypothetical protein
MGKSLIESLAESINEQVQLLVKSVPASELPHLHEATPFPPLDEKYPSPLAFSAFQKILTDAQTLVDMLQPSKVLLVDIAMQGVENQSLRLATEWGIADAIEEAGGSVELAVLAKRYRTEEFKLGILGWRQR